MEEEEEEEVSSKPRKREGQHSWWPLPPSPFFFSSSGEDVDCGSTSCRRHTVEAEQSSTGSHYSVSVWGLETDASIGSVPHRRFRRFLAGPLSSSLSGGTLEPTGEAMGCVTALALAESRRAAEGLLVLTAARARPAVSILFQATLI